MKLTLDNIPIWDAFQSSETECPICAIEEKSESKLLEILFLEMVMDVDFNKKLGREYDFCREHFKKLYNYPDKLGLAIIVEKMLTAYKDGLKKPGMINIHDITHSPGNAIQRLFKGSIGQNYIPGKECFICSRLESGSGMDIENMIHLWEADEDFRSLYSISKGFCVNHYNKAMSSCEIVIADSNARKRFKETTFKVEQESMERLHEELEWFIKKFDYRYSDLPWRTSKDSLPRSILKLTGSFKTD